MAARDTGSGSIDRRQHRHSGRRTRYHRHGRRAPRWSTGRDRAHSSPAPGARGDPRLGASARIPAEHARDRRRRRPDQLLQGGPPAARPWSARATCAATPTGHGRRGRTSPRTTGGRAVARQRASTTRPAAATPSPPPTYVPVSAGSPPAGRSWPSRPSRTSSRCPARSSARARCSCSRSGESMVDAAICDGDWVVVRSRSRGERRHRGGHDRRGGHREDVQAPRRPGLADAAQPGLRADRGRPGAVLGRVIAVLRRV